MRVCITEGAGITEKTKSRQDDRIRRINRISKISFFSEEHPQGDGLR
jgi:hypothetical protein